MGHTRQVISLLVDGHDNSFLYVCASLSFSGDMGLMERFGFRIGDAMYLLDRLNITLILCSQIIIPHKNLFKVINVQKSFKLG